MNRKDKRFFEKEEEGKMMIDEMSAGMETFQIKEINPCPEDTQITTPGLDATPKQRECLNSLLENLDGKGIQVELPKKLEALKRGEAWSVISKLLTKQRQVEKVFAT